VKQTTIGNHFRNFLKFWEVRVKIIWMASIDQLADLLLVVLGKHSLAKAICFIRALRIVLLG
jgi:hypothetical protein